MTLKVDVGVVIVGGGVAGLWLLARLRGLGYGALLIECERLGAGQTIRSQGIIHGGAKYALAGEITRSARALAAMPPLWRRCLAGQGEVDLSAVQVLSEHQYLCAPVSLTSRLFGFIRSKPVQIPLPSLPDEEFPEILRHRRFRGSVYRLDEPVIDPGSLLRALAEPHREAIVLNQGPAVQAPDGNIYLRAPGRAQVAIRPRFIIFTAGAGNAAQLWASMQVRPLHMVMVRGEALPGGVYLHWIGASEEMPRLTITSHRDGAGRTVWYLGGGLAETGVAREPKKQIHAARRELAGLLPWVDLSAARFATFEARRAEARQHDGQRPEGPGVFKMGSLIIAWPTKLALAPMLADEVIAKLEPDHRPPQGAELGALADWPRPEVAPRPWDEEREWS